MLLSYVKLGTSNSKFTHAIFSTYQIQVLDTCTNLGKFRGKNDLRTEELPLLVEEFPFTELFFTLTLFDNERLPMIVPVRTRGLPVDSDLYTGCRATNGCYSDGQAFKIVGNWKTQSHPYR